MEGIDFLKIRKKWKINLPILRLKKGWENIFKHRFYF